MYVFFKGIDEWFNDDEGELKERFKKTYEFLYHAAQDCARVLSKGVQEKIGKDIKIDFSEILLKQSLIDAYDDLRRLTNYHPTKQPNPIKEMAYIVFWLMKHKPIRLLTEDIIKEEKLSNIAKMKLLFINETLGVKLLINSAFEGKKQDNACSRMTKKGEEQLKYMKHFLLYYLTYRMDSPKSLEAIMLSATVHPIWEVNPVIWQNPTVTEEDF